MSIIETGDEYQEEFLISQEQVEKFAEVSGDFNPIHLDHDFAVNTPFKKPIIHGFLGSSIFSKILGTKFPGEGTIYLSQSLEFKRPMFTGIPYVASVKVAETDKAKGTATLETTITDSNTKKVVVTGRATVMNKEKIK